MKWKKNQLNIKEIKHKLIRWEQRRRTFFCWMEMDKLNKFKRNKNNNTKIIRREKLKTIQNVRCIVCDSLCFDVKKQIMWNEMHSRVLWFFLLLLLSQYLNCSPFINSNLSRYMFWNCLLFLLLMLSILLFSSFKLYVYVKISFCPYLFIHTYNFGSAFHLCIRQIKFNVFIYMFV